MKWFCIDKEELFKNGSIRGDAARIYAYQFSTLGLGLLGGIIVARTLGPAQKGVLDVFNLINSFVVEMGSFGFGSGLLYYLANKQRPLGEIHGTGLFFSVMIGLLTALIGWLGLSFWKMLFPGMNTWMILLVFFISPVSYYRLSWSNIMTGINQSVATYKVAVVVTVLSVITIFALWGIRRLDVPNLIGLTVALSIGTAVAGFQMLYRRGSDMAVSTALAKDSLRYGLVVHIGNIANIMHFKIDQMIINYWLGTRAVGIYAVSVNWAEMLFILDSAIISAALYRISSSPVQESYALTRRLFKVQFFISGGTGLILCALSYPLIAILYGSTYVEAVVPLVLLVPGIIAWSVSKILAGFLTYNCNLAAYVTKVAVLGAVLNVVLNIMFVAIAGFGIGGAALSSSISYLLVAVLVGVESNRRGAAAHAY